MKPRYKIGEVLCYKGEYQNIVISKKNHNCIGIKTISYFSSKNIHIIYDNNNYLNDSDHTKITFDSGS